MLNDLAASFSEHTEWFAGAVFILGLLIGSFLNVVIYRLPIILEREWQAQAADVLPQADPADGVTAPTGVADAAHLAHPARFSLSVPRSACPACKTPISAWQNIPIVSWLALRGRCAACRTVISVRYPLVELGTALLSTAVAWRFGTSESAACALLITWALIALAGIDVDHQLLPDDITLPLLWGGLVAAVILGKSAAVALPVGPRDAIIGAAAGYLSLWSVFHVFRLITGKDGMGYGDFKLFAALGAWLGWQLLPLVILLAAAAGAVIGICMIALRGRDRSAPMPFGPYLAAAGWLTMLYGNDIVGDYLRLSGLEH